MKKIILSVIIMCLSFFFYSNSYAEEWKTYESELGFTFDYPSDWTVSRYEWVQEITPPDKSASIVLYMDIACGLTLDELAEEVYSDKIKRLPNIPIEKGKTKISGKEAHYFIFRVEGSNKKHKMYLFCETLAGYNLGCSVSYKRRQESFDEYLPIVEKVISSFKISANEKLKKEIEEACKAESSAKAKE